MTMEASSVQSSHVLPLCIVNFQQGNESQSLELEQEDQDSYFLLCKTVTDKTENCESLTIQPSNNVEHNQSKERRLKSRANLFIIRLILSIFCIMLVILLYKFYNTFM